MAGQIDNKTREILEQRRATALKKQVALRRALAQQKQDVLRRELAAQGQESDVQIGTGVADQAMNLDELIAQKAKERRQSMQPDTGMVEQPAPGGSSTNSEAVSDLRDKGRALMTGVADGASFGFGDNIAAGIGGMGSALRGQGFSRGYEDTLGIAREGMARDKQDNPMLYGSGNIAGATGQALLGAPLATGAKMIGTAVRGGAIGAVEGGLHGGGQADGQDVLENAGWGVGIGGLAGAAVPGLVGGAGALKNAVKDPVTGVIDGMLGRANKGKANRAIFKTLQSSGKKQDDIAAMLSRAAQEGQPEYRMMDALGVAGQRQASGIARNGGDAATEIAEFLEKRQLGQGERVGGFIDDAFGTKGTTAAQTRDSLTSARGQAADTAYDAARGNAAPVDVRGALGVIDKRIGGMEGAGITGDSIDGRLAHYRSRLAGSGKGLGDDVSSAELSDFDRVLGVKQDLYDEIQNLRPGTNIRRELGKLYGELDGALEGSSNMYRTANDGFREASKVIGAVDDGAMMASRGRAADNVPAFQSMNPEMQGAARIGYGDDLLKRIEAATTPTSNRAKALQSFKREAEADAMTIDPRLYRDRLGREDEMWNTQNRALGGSRTADNLADQGAMDGLAGGAMGAGRSALNFQFGDALAKMADTLGPLAKGQNEATRRLIAEALMSSDPAKALAPALRQQRGSEATRRMIESMMRQPGRESIEGLNPLR